MGSGFPPIPEGVLTRAICVETRQEQKPFHFPDLGWHPPQTASLFLFQKVPWRGPCLSKGFGPAGGGGGGAAIQSSYREAVPTKILAPSLKANAKSPLPGVWHGTLSPGVGHGIRQTYAQTQPCRAWTGPAIIGEVPDVLDLSFLFWKMDRQRQRALLGPRTK